MRFDPAKAIDTVEEHLQGMIFARNDTSAEIIYIPNRLKGRL